MEKGLIIVLGFALFIICAVICNAVPVMVANPTLCLLLGMAAAYGYVYLVKKFKK